VEIAVHPEALGIPVTNLERTLIDITVRPDYAGGVQNVLDAFRIARARLSVQTLISTLDQLSYLYPYAQAIGFLLQHAGYDDDCLKPFRARVGQFKF
jgi:predicted transcriptional regulator of viral defense system